MLRIRQDLKQAIIDHAMEDAPIEACGIIAGKDYCGNSADRLIKMDNIAEDWEVGFAFDPQQQLAIWNDLEDRGEVPTVIYHSHTKHSARPSNRDADGAILKQTHYVIVSTVNALPFPDFRSFTIRNGELLEERVEIIHE
jgi:proteasome lid subunit RPN8/RPN11